MIKGPLSLAKLLSVPIYSMIWPNLSIGPDPALVKWSKSPDRHGTRASLKTDNG